MNSLVLSDEERTALRQLIAERVAENRAVGVRIQRTAEERLRCEREARNHAEAKYAVRPHLYGPAPPKLSHEERQRLVDADVAAALMRFDGQQILTGGGTSGKE